MSAPHLPVMLQEVLDQVALRPGELIVDATFGAGGYSKAFLEAGSSVLAFDRDPSAQVFAEPLAQAYPGRFELAPRRFSELRQGLEASSAAALHGGRLDAVVFDIGVSSMQVDEAERGFSFMRDGPLDMRMGADGATAADLVNTSEPEELARIFWVYGEERASRRIAAALVRRREETPFTRTLDLAEAVERAVGGRKGAPTHPATRVFQALRIAVNEELDELTSGLLAAEAALIEGGRLVVVTFHSLEDRIVKAFLSERSGKTQGVSRHMPEVKPGPPPSFVLTTKGCLAPSAAEIALNPRARSAKLRSAQRTGAPVWSAAA